MSDQSYSESDQLPVEYADGAEPVDYADSTDGGAGDYTDTYGGDYVEEKKSIFGVTSIAVLGLFAFLCLMGLRSTNGAVCSQGALAFLFLPIASAVMYGLLKGVVSSVSSGNEFEKAKGLFPKIFGNVGGGSGNLGRISSMLGFATFFALIQYFLTVIFIMYKKPTVPKSTVFRKSFIAFGINFLFSIIFIVAITIVSNVIPPVKAVLTLGTKLPFIGTLMTQGFFWTLATNPLSMLGSYLAHVSACASV
jgi:hypothetical protein